MFYYSLRKNNKEKLLINNYNKKQLGHQHVIYGIILNHFSLFIRTYIPKFLYRPKFHLIYIILMSIMLYRKKKVNKYKINNEISN